MITRLPLVFGCMTALSLLAACGSSGAGDSAAPDTAATADAGDAGAADATASDAAAPAADAPAAEVVTISVDGLTGSSDKGDKVFNQCRACHSVKEGDNRVGPSLFGILGEKAAEVPNYSFSKAMKDSNITWTEEALYEYLENPQKMVPGTTMAFPGIKDGQKRADVIAYVEAHR